MMKLGYPKRGSRWGGTARQGGPGVRGGTGKFDLEGQPVDVWSVLTLSRAVWAEKGLLAWAEDPCSTVLWVEASGKQVLKVLRKYLFMVRAGWLRMASGMRENKQDAIRENSKGISAR